MVVQSDEKCSSSALAYVKPFEKQLKKKACAVRTGIEVMDWVAWLFIAKTEDP